MISDEEFEKLRMDPGPIVVDGNQTNNNTEDAAKHASELQHLALGTHLEDEGSLNDDSLYYNHPVDRLWKFCDSAESSVKLLLPDSQLVPYYLRKPRNNKEKSKKELDREQRVFELYIQKELDGLRSQKVSGPKIPKTSSLSIREE